jgi:hypothetical protein
VRASHLSGQIQRGKAQTHIQRERDNKSVLYRNVNSFSVCLMKSWQATMKSSLRSDEIQGQALDEIKSV